MSEHTTTRRQRSIASAFRDGFGTAWVRAEETEDGEVHVYTTHSTDPVRVQANDVIPPSDFPEGMVAGMRLDVQAVLATEAQPLGGGRRTSWR